MKSVWLVAGVAAGLLLAGCEQKKDQPAAEADKPAAVAEETPDADPGDFMIAAMRAAFPEADPKTGEVKLAAKPGEPQLVERPIFFSSNTDLTLHYLVTARIDPGGCHGCGAPVSVFYLSGGRGEYAVTATWADVTTSGGWGGPGTLSPMSFADGGAGFTDESGFTGQGCTSSALTAFRFEDMGPVKVLDSVGMAYEYEDATVSADIVAPAPAGADLAVHYSGKGKDGKAVDATVTWAMAGDALKLKSGTIPKTSADGC